MDTQTQIDRLIELAIVQRSELKALVEQLPQLREYLGTEIEKTFEAVEPQLRTELEEFCNKKTEEYVEALRGDVSASVGEVLKTLETAAAAKYSALMAERQRNIDLEKQAEQKIAAAAAEIPSKVKDIVAAELARFPRAGEIDKLRKEFAEPRGLNPRGKWQAGETYNRLDLVSYNGDSFVSSVDGNTDKPKRDGGNWTLSAARGTSYGGGGGITSLIDLYNKPDLGQVLIGTGKDYVNANLTAGTGITITNGAGAITIDATGAQETLTATVKNADSVTITRGQVVYLYGATGNMASVKLASNLSDATSAKTFGVVSDASIAPNGTGIITCVGVQSNLNLGSFAEGDTLYLGATAGSVTNVKPYAPNHLVYIGVVQRANNGNGQLYVKVQNGYELDEIHDVQINSPRLAGQTLIYDATNALWKNARLTAGVGVSISNSDSAITISADGGVNYQGTWNASTNTPTLTSSVGTKGFYYVVSVAGSTNLNGVTDWQVGDWAIFNGSAWQKVDTTDQVTSVFGRQGAVTAVSTDYSSVGITNTAIGASNPSTGAFTTLSASGTGAINGAGNIGALSVATTSETALAGPATWSNKHVLLGGVANGTAVTGYAVAVNQSNNDIYTFALAPGVAWRDIRHQAANHYFHNSGSTSPSLTISSTATTLAGNLTVSGTGTSSVAGTFNVQLASMTNAITKGAMTDSTTYGVLSLNGSRTSTAYLGLGGGGGTDNTLFYNVPSGGTHSFRVAFSEVGRFNSSGNLLLGTTSDNGYRLRVVGGNDTQLFLDCAAGVQYTSQYWANAGTAKALAYYDNTAVAFNIGTSVASGQTIIKSGNAVTALTLDGSQNATFVGKATSSAVGPSLGTGINTQNFLASAGSGFVGYSLRRTDDTNGGWLIGTSAAVVGDFAIYQNQGSGSVPVQRLLIGTTGNTTLGGNLTVSGTTSVDRVSAGTALTVLGSGITAGQQVNFLFGKAASTYNQATLIYHHVGDGNTENYLGLGFYGVDDLLNLKANGNVGIGTTSPSGRVHARSDSAGGTTYNLISDNGAGGASINVAAVGFQNGGIQKGSIRTAVYGDGYMAFHTNDDTEKLRITGGGNLLLGTTTDSSNGKLQLATHTTSAGGIGFGSDLALFRMAQGLFQQDSTGTQVGYRFSKSGTMKGQLVWSGSDTYLDYDGSLFLRAGYGGTTALTLDSSQNATFAKKVAFTAQATGTTLVDLSSTDDAKILGYGGGNTFVKMGGNLNLSSAGYTFISTAGSTALTLDSSQNATFAGAITGKQTIAFPSTANAVTIPNGISLASGYSVGYLSFYNGSGGKVDAYVTSNNLIISDSVKMGGLPTSPTGLASGQLWIDTANGRVIKVVA